MKHSQLVVYEHSAAISNIHVDNNELITDDYDGVIILRYNWKFDSSNVTFDFQ